FAANGKGITEAGRYFFAGRGNPLESGKYYIAVQSGPGNTNDLNYELHLRGLFPNGSFTDVPFVGSAAKTQAMPHQVDWYRVQVPENSSSWKLRLNCNAGDGMLVVHQPGLLPNYGALGTTLTSSINGMKVQKLSHE